MKMTFEFDLNQAEDAAAYHQLMQMPNPNGQHLPPEGYTSHKPGDPVGRINIWSSPETRQAAIDNMPVTTETPVEVVHRSTEDADAVLTETTTGKTVAMKRPGKKIKKADKPVDEPADKAADEPAKKEGIRLREKILEAVQSAGSSVEEVKAFVCQAAGVATMKEVKPEKVDTVVAKLDEFIAEKQSK